MTCAYMMGGENERRGRRRWVGLQKGVNHDKRRTKNKDQCRCLTPDFMDKEESNKRFRNDFKLRLYYQNPHNIMELTFNSIRSVFCTIAKTGFVSSSLCGQVGMVLCGQVGMVLCGQVGMVLCNAFASTISTLILSKIHLILKPHLQYEN